MGITNLWGILKPAEKHVPVLDLSGKRVAVDLSTWVMEFKKSPGTTQVPNLYLRNLYFRTLSFMRAGIDLVFVLDGSAPEIKAGALKARQAAQYKSSDETSVNTDRRGLKQTLEECACLLRLMGYPCVESQGEAECLCAYLDQNGEVDGSFTSDSDYFCYGGKTVYTHLKKEGGCDVVDMYSSEMIESMLTLTRDDLISLALMLGCDYGRQGIPGVGPEKAMALIKYLKNKQLPVLDRLLGWTENKELDDVERQLAKPVKKEPHCSKCQHLGRKVTHVKSGCRECATHEGCLDSCDIKCACPWDKQQALEREHKLELSVRVKGKSCQNFPNKQIIEEFRNGPSRCLSRGHGKVGHRRAMDVNGVIKYMQKKLSWDRTEVLNSIVPAVILQQLHGGVEGQQPLFTPVRIARSCKVHRVDCYEVEWDKSDSNNWAGDSHATSVKVKVDKKRFETCFHELVADYEQELGKEKAGKSAGKKRKAAPETDGKQKSVKDMLKGTKAKQMLVYQDPPLHKADHKTNDPGSSS